MEIKLLIRLQFSKHGVRKKKRHYIGLRQEVIRWAKRCSDIAISQR